MMKKIVVIFVFMILVTTILPLTAIAGDEENPEIDDEIEDDIFDYLDIISAWFYEQADKPDFLFIGLKLKEINTNPFKQHLTVHWEYNGIPCAAMMSVGYQGFKEINYSAGWGHGFWFQEHYQRIEGNYDEETGIINMKIPKSFIKDPQKGEVLTNSFALTFQRFGFIGRMGFDRAILQFILFKISGLDRSDIGPNEGYGKDYVIQF